MFKSLTDVTQQLSGLLKSARGLTEKASGEGYGQGLKGIVQDALDLNIESYIENVDMQMGGGVLHLTQAGDSKGVESAIRFRDYAVMRLEEVREMRDIANAFLSHDIDVVKRAAGQMGEFLEGKQTEVACSEYEEALKQEIHKLRKLSRGMSAFLENEEALLKSDQAQRKKSQRETKAPASDGGPTSVTRLDEQRR